MKWFWHLLGMGGAKVNLTLPQNTFEKGHLFRGDLSIIGGKNEQEVIEIKAHVCTKYIEKPDDEPETRIVQTTLINSSIITKEKQENFVPIEFPLSYKLPFTAPGTPLFILVNVEFDYGLGKSVYIPFELKPLPWEKAVLAYFESIGFKLLHVTLRDMNSRKLIFKALNEEQELHTVRLTITYLHDDFLQFSLSGDIEDFEVVQFEGNTKQTVEIKEKLQFSLEKYLV